MPTMKGHLVGAHGLFWERDYVDWTPGRARPWQLLGVRYPDSRSPQVCDFRSAGGVYILYDHYGPQYTGIARGVGGLGSRLKQHHAHEPHDIRWTRFSWFSFDNMAVAKKRTGWSVVDFRDGAIPTNGDLITREVEALLIKVFGLRSQNQMQFQAGFLWEQLDPWTAYELFDGRRVDPTGFTSRYWEAWDIGVPGFGVHDADASAD